MSGINLALIVGYVGKDPEIRTTQSGSMIASFSVATSEKWKDKSGEYQEKTEWHNITAFGKTAEIISQYVTKGMLISIQGRIQTDSYEKDGIKRYSTKIICDKMQMLSRSESQPIHNPAQPTVYGGPGSPKPFDQGTGFNEPPEEYIPF